MDQGSIERHRRERPSGPPRGFRRILKIAVTMFWTAIAVAWIAALAYPKAVELGLSEASASRLPNFGLLVGAALGFMIRTVDSVKYFLTSLSLIVVTACVFWFYALEFEGVLVIGFGLSERTVKWLQPAAFWFGFLLSAFALAVEIHEMIGPAVQDRRKKPARR